MIETFRLQASSLQAGGVELARNIDLSLLPGQISVLSGPNGVGKSTLLNHWAQQEAHPVLLYRPAFGLRDELTVHAQAQSMIQALAFDTPSQGVRLSIEDGLSQVGLEAWQEEKVGSLSSGQKARLGMLSLLVGQAPVWLLDEPMNALDHDSVQLLAQLIRRHLGSGGRVLLVSHLGQAVLEKALPGVGFVNHVWSGGQIKPQQPNIQHALVQPETNQSASAIQTRHSMTFAALLAREWRLFLATSGALWWSALFLLMILSFFGLAVGQPEREVALAVVWVGVLLAALLPAKDWFLDDSRCGWLRLMMGLTARSASVYWLGKTLTTWGTLSLIVLPVSALGSVLLGLPGNVTAHLLLALLVGLLAAVPLLALVSLMVLMTRGGAVLVYILALPMMVPVLIFGLEASQAESLGRSAWPALSVLLTTSGLGFLLGPWVADKLIDLILQ